MNKAAKKVNNRGKAKKGSSDRRKQQKRHNKTNLQGQEFFKSIKLSEASYQAAALRPKIVEKSNKPKAFILASRASRWTLNAATVARKEILFLPRILEFSKP